MTGKVVSFICCTLLFSSLLLAPALSSRAGSVPKHEYHDNHKARAAARLHAPEQPLGFSIDKIDPSVDPGQDFYQFAAGNWLKQVKIPDTEVGTGELNGLANNISKQVLSLLEKAAATSNNASKGSVEQQVGDLYASAMDTERLEKLGYSPIKPELARIDALKSLDELPAHLAKQMLTTGSGIFLAPGVTPDDKQSTVNALKIIQGSLSLGERNSYLDKDSAGKRTAYVRYISNLLQLIDISPGEAEKQARTILEMETILAEAHLTPLQMHDPKTTYNKMTIEELQKLEPGFDVVSFLTEIGISPLPETVIVSSPKYVQALGHLLKERSFKDVKTYLRFRLVNNATGNLSQKFMQLDLDFHLKTLLGIKKLKPRDEFMAQTLQSHFGHPVARLYVKEYLAPESKKQVEVMVGHIRDAFAARLHGNPWLADTTRAAALEKLNRMEINVGYPEKWIDYSSVDIRRDDFYGNMVRLNLFDNRRDLAKLGTPVGADGFSVPGATLPTDINAAYQPQYNKIEISAAILQPPFFFPDLDPAVSYGAIGSVIGHEITHGFDSRGRLFDSLGNLNNWWTEKDGKEFTARAEVLVKQFDSYEALPGLHVNGKLTLGENIADLGGITLAYTALKKSMEAEKDAKKIDGYTAEQRFFLSWTHLWLEKYRPAAVKILVKTNAHPPSRFRVTGPIIHLDGFYDAFAIDENDPMYHPKNERLTIW